MSLARLADSAKIAVVAKTIMTTMMERLFFILIPFVLFFIASEVSEALMNSHKKMVQFRFNFLRKTENTYRHAYSQRFEENLKIISKSPKDVARNMN